MRRAEVLRSTPFRLALAFTALFLVSIVIAGAIAVKAIGDDLQVRLDTGLTESFNLIAQSYGESDVEDLVASVNSYISATNELDRVFLLTDPDGKVLAGNIGDAKVAEGLSDATAPQFGINDDPASYRVLSGPVAENRLVVGTSYDETSELQALALSSFGWSAAIAGGVALIAGLIVARIVGARLQDISRTMHEVGQGDLRARITETRGASDLDLLAAQINAALDRLSANVESIQQVSVDIAHDLKTPLNRLSMTIETALEKSATGISDSDELNAAQDEIRQISATFEALLRIAQIEAGLRREKFRQVSLRPILDSVADAYDSVAEENGQKLVYSNQLSLDDFCLGDKDLLTQLLANLVENAIKHSGETSIIAVTASRRERDLEILISDTGPGIPVHERDKVFRRMYRLDKSRTTSGSGLGLSLVKAIADLHHATITLADNAPGLKVTVTVPRM